MAGTGVALAALGAGTGRATSATAATATGKAVQVGDRRKLGSLEVSAVGLGVQNMHRTYQTIIPDRAETDLPRMNDMRIPFFLDLSENVAAAKVSEEE